MTYTQDANAVGAAADAEVATLKDQNATLTAANQTLAAKNVDLQAQLDAINKPPVPPQPPVAVTEFGGASYDMNAYVAAFGPPVAHRTYEQTPAGWNQCSAAGDDALGVTDSIVSFKYDPTKAFPTAAFVGLVRSIPKKAGRKRKLVPWHEPENDVKAGAFTFAQWRNMVIAFGTALKGENRPDLECWICTMGAYTFSTARPFGDPAQLWEPAMAAVVDGVMHDSYVNLKGNAGYNKSSSAVMDLCEAFNKNVAGGKAIGFGEIAMCEGTTPGAKAADITAMMIRAKKNGYGPVCYFDVKGVHYAKDPTYLLRSSTGASAAWLKGLG